MKTVKQRPRPKTQTLITKWVSTKKKDATSTDSVQKKKKKMSIQGLPQSWSHDTGICFVLKNPKYAGSSAYERYQKYKHAKTIQDALQNGAFSGDLVHDFSKGFLKRATEKADPKAFKFAVSLGARCLVADTLRDQGLRRFALPFDWIYSSPEMVTHCLRDDFFKLFDRKLIIKSGNAYGHRFYGPMLNRGIVFPHHDPSGKDRADFEKRIERFRMVISDKRRKLFVVTRVIESAALLIKSRSKPGRRELTTLFQSLIKRGVSNFTLLAVNLVCGGASEATTGPLTKPLSDESQKSGDNAFLAFELHCIGPCTGLRLKKKEDIEALGEIILADRCFDLAPDPLQDTSVGKASSTILHPKLSVKRDANGNWRPKHMD